MYEVDLDKFWAADEIAHCENCFTKEATQVALGIRMSNECVFAELNEAGSPWGYIEPERQAHLNKRYNDIAERIVGKRLLSETVPSYVFPAYTKIGTLFGGTYSQSDHGEWLHSKMNTPEDLEAQLNLVDKMDLKDMILPKNWASEKRRIFEEYGAIPPLMRSVRGPVTLATSLMGVENFILLMYDEPELAQRFSESITRVLLAYIDITNEEAGYTDANAPDGFGFFDDECAMMTPEMYEAFGYPVLRDIFHKVSPNKNDGRYQHSDSEMSHLLPILGRLDLTGCNFGPTLTVSQIRKHLPNARIDGQLAPFTFMNNNPEEIIAEVKRDCEMAKIDDLRGVNIATAGSINNGSSLMSMRTVMHAIQKYGQY